MSWWGTARLGVLGSYKYYHYILYFYLSIRNHVDFSFKISAGALTIQQKRRRDNGQRTHRVSGDLRRRRVIEGILRRRRIIEGIFLFCFLFLEESSIVYFFPSFFWFQFEVSRILEFGKRLNRYLIFVFYPFRALSG